MVSNRKTDIFSWDRFFELKFSVSPNERLVLIRLFYGFLTLPGMDVNSQTIWLGALVKLLKYVTPRPSLLFLEIS